VYATGVRTTSIGLFKDEAFARITVTRWDDMNRINLVALLTLAALVALAGATVSAADRSMTAYRDALLARIAGLEATLPDITRSTDQAAERLISGGNLYAAGQAAFVSEACGRAGGLMMIRNLSDGTMLSPNDVILVGAWTDRDEAARVVCRRAKEAGAYAVLFSPAFRPQSPMAGLCSVHVVTCESDEGLAVPLDRSRYIVPTAPLFGITALWAYTGELIGSLTRKGRTPVIWKSVALPEGRKRNALYLTGDLSRRRFHADISVPPLPEGTLGRGYLDVLRRQVSGLRGATLDRLAVAARMMGDCVRRGGTVHVQTISHFTRYEVASGAVPGWVRDADASRRKPELLAAAMKPGDVFFEVGYCSLKPTFIKVVRKAGATSVVALCHAPAAQLDGPQPDMLIDSQWEYGDAALLLPGYDVKVLPTSGILQTVLFWTVMAEAEGAIER